MKISEPEAFKNSELNSLCQQQQQRIRPNGGVGEKARSTWSMAN